MYRRHYKGKSKNKLNVYRPYIYFGKQLKLPQLFLPSKTATLVHEFAVEDFSWAELQPWFLHL